MNFRTVYLNGKKFQVPQGINRIDSDKSSTHGWQVRHKGTKFFSDGVDQPAQSLNNAIAELEMRLKLHPKADYVVQNVRQEALPHKRSNLPVGIFGPYERRHRNKPSEARFSVLLPMFNGKPVLKHVYIANQNTWDQQRYDRALAKALKMRNQAVKQFQSASKQS